MSYYCFKCSADLGEEVIRGKAERSQVCPACKSDMHVCKNCKHYDLAAYNQCKESSAERVVDKERANFCDYFSFIDKKTSAKNNSSTDNTKKDYLKELDKLFK